MSREVKYRRPHLYPKQEAAIFAGARYAVVEASTKSGKTFGCMAWLLERAMCGAKGQNFWWVAPVYTQASMVFDRFKQSLPKSVYASHEGKLMLTLGNGARLWFKGADNPDSLYGDDVYAAVIDEASRCKEEAWHAVRSTLTATRGPIRIIGNVKGRKNWAYYLARRAEAGEPGMSHARITAYDAIEGGVLDVSEIEDAKRALPEHVFRELYLAEPSDDEGNPFGGSAIRACLAPLSDAPPVVYGVDLAKSVDWTVIIGLDAQGHVCRFRRFQKPWAETKQAIRAEIDEMPALIDSTGVGDPLVEDLQRAGANVRGFTFSSGSKQQLMEGLTVAIQQGLVTFPEGPIEAEMQSFEYVYTRTGVRYSAPEGQHDDCVMALALAVQEFMHLRPSLSFVALGGPAPRDEEAMRAAAVRELEETVQRNGFYWPNQW